jgi:hypothetical protein
VATVFALMVNPKNGRLVEVSAGRGGAVISSPGIGEIGHSDFRAETQNIGRGEYKRIDTPSGVNPKGEGYGLMLYTGSALVAGAKHSVDGVYSIEGDRSSKAEAIWAKMVQSGIAEEDTAEVEGEREEVMEHCAPIEDRELDNGGYIADDEICGRVTVTYSGVEQTVTFIDMSTVRESQLVLAFDSDGLRETAPSDDLDEDERAPIDLVVRVKVSNQAEATKVFKLLESFYGGEAAAAFMMRPDVAELFGQQRLLAMLGGLGAGARRVHGLPPVSAKTRRIVARFKDVP